ncbi:hypothetical protein [Dysosmobacter sp.]|uniref:hypothetical protein n=1 Tax=Dysosmobacter sp. TaxID=2591382 RepID=UPI002A9ED145|nr:hypothetical protein [Dysosmobacter sp.]MCI6055123.1 hypothetical protein [Dysosmobacter sp.]MDY5508956.1 hypothetical protein [Dysosmobacter sp.]
MKRTTLAYCLVMVLGVALVAMGLLDIRAQFLPTAASEILAPLGGLAIGLGIAGLIGQSMIQSDPVLQQREKARNDERNTAIRYRAQAWAGNVTTVLLALGGAVSSYLDVPEWITWTLLGIAAFNVLLTGVFTLWLRRRM